MYVYDGDNAFATEIAVLTGILPGDVSSTGRDIYISFISDVSETASGFRIHFDTGKKLFSWIILQKLLIESRVKIEGKHIVICGRSNIVGKPLSNLLSNNEINANATVTLCHSKTQNLIDYTRTADISIVAVGSSEFITESMIKKGSVVIDVGINRIKDNSVEKGYRIVGDVDFKSVINKVSKITPVPGGVGPMTIAMLLENVLKSSNWKYCKSKNYVYIVF